MTDILTLTTQTLPLLLLVAFPVALVRWLAAEDVADPPRLPDEPGWPRGVQEPDPEPWRFAVPAGSRPEPPAGAFVRRKVDARQAGSDRRRLVVQPAAGDR
jgi:hypothetical protein